MKNSSRPRLNWVCSWSRLFKIFDLNWLSGDPATALNEVNTTVLPQKLAKKCFWRLAEALGQTIVMDNRIPLIVRGVVEDLPSNCDFPLFILVSYPTIMPNKDLYFYDEKEWGSCSSNNQVFALLRDANQFSAAAATSALIGKDEYQKGNERRKVSKKHILQPLADLHFNEEAGNSGSHSISKSRLWVLACIGLLVLVMACFNFINLATALATLRAKEVGVRKTLGGSRGALVSQFMGETALIVLLSVLAGVVLAKICAPLLKHISEVPDDLPFLSDPSAILFLVLTALAVCLFSGLYPSLVLSGYNPVRALKNETNASAAGGAPLRKALVVMQFTIAQALIVGAIVTIGQLDYIRNMDLGFKKDLIYTFAFSGDSTSQAKLDGFKQRLLQIPGVESASFSSDQPSSGNTWTSNFAFGRGSEDAPFNTNLKFCDADYTKTYGLQLAAGRWMEPSDTMREAVVNETMLKKLGIANPESVIGKEIRIGGRRYLQLVGVVQDFHVHSAHQAIEPVVMSTRRAFYWETGVKIMPQNIAATTEAIQKTFDATFPEQVFEGRYFDESIARFYSAENRFSACKACAGLAILISCLGLFGLASHAAARRTKEIGIRKVLGASVAGITGLLAKDFLKLVVFAILIASPLAYFLCKMADRFCLSY
ncbi:MAG: FtsX-like permease family protein [Lewinellaceae bacterium]|nr:FtsX-like permease family protein [Lewinellaceae bacterium]